MYFINKFSDEFTCAVPGCGKQHLERGSECCCSAFAKAITKDIQADRNLLREQVSLFRVSTSSKCQQKVEILIGQPKSQQFQAKVSSFHNYHQKAYLKIVCVKVENTFFSSKR